MPRVFNRIVTFRVQGEIYDTETSPEDIIRSYTWKYKDYHNGKDHFYIEGEHKDYRGRITNMIKLPKIHLYKKPDTELFLI